MRIILILFLFITTTAVEARMYQWVEPGVETTQLSGKPPAWYRSGEGGPRVFVFDKGRLIDDTAVEVSDEIRLRMRQEAFVLVEEDRQKAQAKFAKAEEMKKKLKQDKSNNSKKTDSEDEAEGDSVVDLITDTLFPDKKQEKDSSDSMTDEKLNELRAVISDWEKSQTESAKQALE